MDLPIEHIQHIIEDKLSKLPSEIHRCQCDSQEYWYHVGECRAYEEVLQNFKSMRKSLSKNEIVLNGSTKSLEIKRIENGIGYITINGHIYQVIMNFLHDKKCQACLHENYE